MKLNSDAKLLTETAAFHICYVRMISLYNNESPAKCVTFWGKRIFLTYEIEFVLFLAVLENSVLSMG